VLAIAAIAPAAASGPPGARASRAHQRPNFLLILVDDQAMNTFTPRFMPKTFRWIVRPGTRFADGLAAPPLCCPDRAGILTGQYPHNNGVFSNQPGYASLIRKRNVLPVWLGRAGYRTALVGKFLNNYSSVRGYAPAPGFGFWFAYDGVTRYFDYTMSDQGTPRFYGSDRRDYSTHVYTQQALRFVRQPNRRPFFLWLAYNAPHASHFHRPHCDGYDPVPPTTSRYLRVDRLRLPRPPSFGEADVSDKPKAIASLPRIDATRRAYIARRYRCTVATMAAVDHGVDRVMRTLRHRGELRRTIVLYLSDNGYFFGEHRIQSEKSYPYEPALQVPFAVRVPSAYRRRAQPRATHRVVAEQDVPATLLDYAGARSCAGARRCRAVDGRTLRPLLGGGGRWPARRGVLAELDYAGIHVHYSAIRTRRYMYAEYADGERELYDLVNDPFELRNRAMARRYRGVETALARRLAALRHCKGHRGRHPCE
jgi:N-acetylglucosamine-6-sulfatase